MSHVVEGMEANEVGAQYSSKNVLGAGQHSEGVARTPWSVNEEADFDARALIADEGRDQEQVIIVDLHKQKREKWVMVIVEKEMTSKRQNSGFGVRPYWQIARSEYLLLPKWSPCLPLRRAPRHWRTVQQATAYVKRGVQQITQTRTNTYHTHKSRTATKIMGVETAMGIAGVESPVPEYWQRCRPAKHPQALPPNPVHKKRKRGR